MSDTLDGSEVEVPTFTTSHARGKRLKHLLRIMDNPVARNALRRFNNHGIILSLGLFLVHLGAFVAIFILLDQTADCFDKTSDATRALGYLHQALINTRIMDQLLKNITVAGLYGPHTSDPQTVSFQIALEISAYSGFTSAPEELSTVSAYSGFTGAPEELSAGQIDLWETRDCVIQIVDSLEPFSMHEEMWSLWMMGISFTGFGKNMYQNYLDISSTSGPGLSEYAGFRTMHTQLSWLISAKYNMALIAMGNNCEGTAKTLHDVVLALLIVEAILFCGFCCVYIVYLLRKLNTHRYNLLSVFMNPPVAAVKKLANLQVAGLREDDESGDEAPTDTSPVVAPASSLKKQTEAFALGGPPGLPIERISRSRRSSLQSRASILGSEQAAKLKSKKLEPRPMSAIGSPSPSTKKIANNRRLSAQSISSPSNVSYSLLHVVQGRPGNSASGSGAGVGQRKSSRKTLGTSATDSLASSADLRSATHALKIRYASGAQRGAMHKRYAGAVTHAGKKLVAKACRGAKKFGVCMSTIGKTLHGEHKRGKRTEKGKAGQESTRRLIRNRFVSWWIMAPFLIWSVLLISVYAVSFHWTETITGPVAAMELTAATSVGMMRSVYLAHEASLVPEQAYLHLDDTPGFDSSSVYLQYKSMYTKYIANDLALLNSHYNLLLYGMESPMAQGREVPATLDSPTFKSPVYVTGLPVEPYLSAPPGVLADAMIEMVMNSIPIAYESLAMQSLLFNYRECLRGTDTSTSTFTRPRDCFQEGQAFYEATHNGVNSLMFDVMGSIQTIVNTAEAGLGGEPYLTLSTSNPLLKFVWQTGLNDLYDGMEETLDLHDSDVINQVTTLHGMQIAILVVCFLLIVVFVVYMIFPLVRQTKDEGEQVALMLSEVQWDGVSVVPGGGNSNIGVEKLAEAALGTSSSKRMRGGRWRE
eukprot:gene11279-18911_t